MKTGFTATGECLFQAVHISLLSNIYYCVSKAAGRGPYGRNLMNVLPTATAHSQLPVVHHHLVANFLFKKYPYKEPTANSNFYTSQWPAKAVGRIVVVQ